MLESPLAPYLLWAKSRAVAPVDLAGSNLLHCTLDDLPGAREAVDLSAPNDNGYAPLVERIAAHYGVTDDRVVTASGCSGANFLAIAALVGAGDEVLAERPGYDPLTGACRLMGARLVAFDRRHDAGWNLDLDEIAARLTPRTRLIILSRPHNPSGALVPVADLRELGRLAERAAAYVLVDEVYLDAAMMLRPGEPRTPAATLGGPFISTSSLTKSYGLAGLRCGWAVTSSANMAERLRRTRDVVDNASSGPSDRLAAFAFERLPALAARATALVGGNVARARAFFDAQLRLELAQPPGCSVVFPRIAGVADAGPFVTRLLERHGVGVAPGAFFHAPAHFRVSLAGRPDVLEAGLSKIGAALAEPDDQGAW
jgi:hypothetical protein